MTKTFWIGLIIILTISLSSVAYQKYLRNPSCTFDGSAVTSIYEVEIFLKDNTSKKFCSIYCASKWFGKNNAQFGHAVVTDEIRGNKIDSYMAYFVKSNLVTNKTNNNRIHAFQQRQYALLHADKFQGEMVDDPFEIEE